MSRPVSHLRVGVRPASKRIGGYRGTQGVTLCGAPITSFDSNGAEAKRFTPEQVEDFNVCRDCMRLLKGE